MLKCHMLRCYRPLQGLRRLGYLHVLGCNFASSSSVRASKAEKLESPVPGTVKQYEQHVMIQAAPLRGDQAALQCHSVHGLWWPSVVEKHPAVIEAIAAAARSEGVVKVTTYEELSRDTFLEAGKTVCDLRIYPAGVQYTDLPINQVRQVTLAHMDTTSAAHDSNDSEEDSSPAKPDPLLDLQRPLEGLQLYVCCHGSRDTRCGKLGNALVTALDTMVRQNQLQNMVQVFKCSHIGGHKYAGNVLVYGAISPCDGDWFGGINASNAAAFLEGLINAEVGKEGGAQEPALRPYWRGRMGASKQDQLDLYEGRLASEEDLSSSDEEAEQRSTLRHRVNGAQLASIPQPIQACSNWQIHGSEEPAHMQDPSQCSCQSDDVRLTEQGHEQPEKDAETNPLEPVQDSSSSDEDTSSSDSDNSSSSGDDPDDVQPIQIETLKT